MSTIKWPPHLRFNAPIQSTKNTATLVESSASTDSTSSSEEDEASDGIEILTDTMKSSTLSTREQKPPPNAGMRNLPCLLLTKGIFSTSSESRRGGIHSNGDVYSITCIVVSSFHFWNAVF